MIRLILLLALGAAVVAVDFNGPTGEGGDVSATYVKEIEEKAARFRIERAKSKLSAADEIEALRLVTEARAELAAKHEKKARKLAEQVIDNHPYSKAAPAAQHVMVAAYAEKERIGSMRIALSTLWWYYPEYDQLGSAMLTALDAAERAQGFTARIDLDAEDPQKVISLEGATYLDETNQLFAFLAQHGDREAVAPRAQLGFARARLLKSDTRFLGISPESIQETYSAYEGFLSRWPDHTLTFTALCELALSRLITYRGDKFDVGALDAAVRLIDQAEQETRNDPERTRLVQAYRKRIRLWHQARDLEVARWYHHRKSPAFLAWLRDPSPTDYTEAARHYYREVIRRDASSELARIAERALATLPAPRQESFGSELLKPAKP